ncbi:MAG: hypothetical protein ACP5T3_00410 [Candidatus Micrarchaeia archaeon]
MQNEERNTGLRAYAAIVLVLASLALVFYTYYFTDVIAINYGVGAGAKVQAAAYSENVTQVLVPVVEELTNLHRAMLETYVLLIVALASLAISFTMLITRAYKGASSKRYAAWHVIASVLFLLLFVTVLAYFSYSGTGMNIEIAAYATLALAIGADAYFLTMQHKRQTQQARTVEIEPELPYANIIKLREAVFASLNGNVHIVDKHFNSEALENLYRLVSRNTSIKSISIVTHTEALDSGFGKNYNDFKKELTSKGTEVSLFIMSDADAVMQHERFIFDNSSAFKIPPLSIINEKSEHITRIRRADAKARFDELAKNAIKYENYVIKKARPDAYSR